MTQIKATDYEVIDHGIDGAQYFQGCGVAFTKFEHVVTGCGTDYVEALDDALEQAAQDGIDAEDLQRRIRLDYTYFGSESVPEDAEDMYYYVSIRYNG